MGSVWDSQGSVFGPLLFIDIKLSAPSCSSCNNKVHNYICMPVTFLLFFILYCCLYSQLDSKRHFYSASETRGGNNRTHEALCCACSFMFAWLGDRDEPFTLWFWANVNHTTLGDGLPTTERQQWKSGGGALDYLFVFQWRKPELRRHDEAVTHKSLFI